MAARLLVSGGQPVTDPAPPAPEETNVRNPVTGAGLSADGNTLWLVVVDGRAPATSIGLTRPQFGALFLALGANSAMAFDSGGSSEMVVRHVGDLTTSVANTPSDGRERSIADGLLVLNAATPGPVTSVVLKAPSGASARRQQAGYRGPSCRRKPAAVDVASARCGVPNRSRRDCEHRWRWHLDSLATRNGRGERNRVGNERERGSPRGAGGRRSSHRRAGGLPWRRAPRRSSTPARSRATDNRSRSMIRRSGGAYRAAAAGWQQTARSSRLRSPRATSSRRKPVERLRPRRFCRAIIRSCSRPCPKRAPLPSAWHYGARPAGLPGGVDSTAAPDGSAALRLAYDFSSGGSTRAAYAQTSLALPGAPLALAIDVFGDKNGEWLRGGYTNADGNSESLTIARHVDWQGWKTIRVAIPPQAAWPIVWTRLYVVERSKDAREQGSLWFRNLRVFLAGPS